MTYGRNPQQTPLATTAERPSKVPAAAYPDVDVVLVCESTYP
jgi:hypothetical protein